MDFFMSRTFLPYPPSDLLVIFCRKLKRIFEKIIEVDQAGLELQVIDVHCEMKFLLYKHF